METLSKRLRDTFQNIQYNSYTPLEVEQLSEKWAKEVENIAIEFAKKLMETKIYACREGKIGNIGQTVNGKIPHEYSFMKGELIINGDKLFDKFIEEYYV